MTVPEEEDLSPDEDVWNHIDSGWQQAYDDIARKLAPETFEFYSKVAKLIVGMKSDLRIDASRAPIGEKLRSIFAEVPEGAERQVLTALLQWYSSGKDPWLTHAVDLQLASEGIGRSTDALKRFADFAPQFGNQSVPEKVLPYLRETVSAYLFGFDAACIALSRACLEQVGKDRLVKLGVFTAPQLRKDGPGLETITKKLKEANALDHSYEAAVRLRKRGNDILHDHLFPKKIRRQTALDAITDLTSVLRELLP
ncbi:MAG: hypothetical protein H0W63_11260 [Gemmatimonadaceae bacterium]|nr:hypothetical protein [Gemmatimonadaceae bacterium]